MCTTRTENTIAALDLAFRERYGWREGTVAKMPLWNVFLALEHAMDYDDPYKPSIWEITK